MSEIKYLNFSRFFTKEGEHPYDKVEWKIFDAIIQDVRSGKINFEQRGVEFPSFYSQQAVNIIVSKYFRGILGTKNRETSLKNIIDRVVKTNCDWAVKQGYFKSDADQVLKIFSDELTYILLHQMASFNSPVWFNIGFPGRPQQTSACFIVGIEDDMDSILDAQKTEGIIFKGGSGSGINFSNLRSKYEMLSAGGESSGPLSFMKGMDAWGGIIKCVLPDTMIFTENGIVEIGNFLKDAGRGYRKFSGTKIAAYKKFSEVTHSFVSEKVPTLKISLGNTGIVLGGSYEHPVLTMNKNLQYEWKKMSSLVQGDYVAVKRGGNFWSKSNPIFSYHVPPGSQICKNLSYPNTMTRELARLLGYLVSEGSIERCGKNCRFRFSNADKETFDDFVFCVESVFGVKIQNSNISKKINKKTKVITYAFDASWHFAMNFFDYIGLPASKSSQKQVPWSILCSTREMVIEYLGAYFEGDGCCSGDIVFCCSASEKLIHQTQQLLLNIGIISQISNKIINKTRYYQITITGKDVNIFSEYVSLISPRKINMLRQCSSKVASKKENTNYDIVPFVLDHIDCMKNKLGIKNGYLVTSSGEKERVKRVYFTNSVRINDHRKGNISYGFLSKYNDEVEEISQWCEGLSESIRTISEDHFLWDYVDTIEDGGVNNTYDVTVSPDHTFLSNSIVSHNSGGGTRRAAKMAILNIDHPEIMDFISCKVREEEKAYALIREGYDSAIDGDAYSTIAYQNANHSVRISDEFMEAYENGEKFDTKFVTTKKKHKSYDAKDIFKAIASAAHRCGDPGIQFDDLINRMNTCKTERLNSSNPCSEYIDHDNSSCNLASLNLMKFYDVENRCFKVEDFIHAVRVMSTAMDIWIDMAFYPTEKLSIGTKKYRTIGLGYSNLGSLIMSEGIPYDSDEARSLAASITSLMTSICYQTSSENAAILGFSFPEWSNDKNKDSMMEVMGIHRDENLKIKKTDFNKEILVAAKKSWDWICKNGRKNGFRNSFTTVIAPTGTISFMMDCDTTGVEPELGLVKYKTLVGSDTMIKMINNVVKISLKNLDYTENEINKIIKHIEDTDSIEGAPGLKEKHLPVFDCSFKPGSGVRFIHHMGHLKMLGAIQPFLSGAASKTINIPENSTIEDFIEIYYQAWKLGVKCVAIYRDNCKGSQPLTTVKEKRPRATRVKLPEDREARTHKFEIDGHEGYLTIGKYTDGSPGEIFIEMNKKGSTINGIMDCLAISMSLGLQYGIPLKAYVDKLINQKFEPSGFTKNKKIPMCSSVADYIAKYISINYFNEEDKKIINIVPKEEQSEKRYKKINKSSISICPECGSMMESSGTCKHCPNCGRTTGCS